MYFQPRAAAPPTGASYSPDSPHPGWSPPRIGTGLILAAFVGTAALLALGTRTGIE
jgi:hypothetical protein